MEELPRKFGRYRLTALLGRGGQASVFRGESEPVAGVVRNVAIKRIHQQSEDGIRLLVEEARIWVRLQHPNIVSVVDFGEEDGDWFLALELVDGISASALLQQTGALPTALALFIAERVARALGHAHSLTDDEGRPSNVIHRDVKPGNILLSRQGAVKLSDFGIARGAYRTTKTVAGTVKGSYGYFSPEQARGEELDGRTDLFSLGCTLFELLTGRLPVPDEKEAGMRAAATGQIERPPSSLSIPVRQLLVDLLAPRREDRLANGDDVARRIHALLAPDNPDDLAQELGRFVRNALGSSASAVLPEDPPSLVSTQQSDNSIADKTRVSKPPAQEPDNSLTAPGLSTKVSPAPPAEKKRPSARHANVLPDPPPAAPPGAKGTSVSLREMMLPFAGVAVAIGAVILAVLPEKEKAETAPSPTPTIGLLADLLASNPPSQSAASSLQAARVENIARTKPGALARLEIYSLAKSEPANADLQFEAWRFLAQPPIGTDRSDAETSRKMARELASELVARNGADPRVPVVRRWLDVDEP